ncbi:MAG: phosphate acyltransferase PlsX [Chloroflexi bacterium]|nr:phosphate acyltransferase PlsX [Chloroflexota bacterium]
MRIVLDAMGSDHAPEVDVEGGVRAARRFGQEVVLVGRRDAIEAELAKYDTAGLPLSIVHASEVVTMDEHPSQAVRNKPDASIVVGMGQLREGKADALVSMGNSGGVLAAAVAGEGRIGRIPGVQRPAISTVFPHMEGFSFLLDIGANTDCKPDWLAQFALMGAVYARNVLHIANPRVALLSNGEEEIKGNRLVQETRELLRQLHLNFIGNVEGKDLPRGLADVIVTDGFVGNVAIKTAEGVATMILSLLKSEIRRRPLAVLGGLLAKPAFKAAGRRLDYREYGGAPLLGVNGVVIIGHGRSDALAVENAIGLAITAVRSNLIETIRQDIQDAMTVLAHTTRQPKGAGVE